MSINNPELLPRYTWIEPISGDFYWLRLEKDKCHFCRIIGKIGNSDVYHVKTWNKNPPDKNEDIKLVSRRYIGKRLTPEEKKKYLPIIL